MRALLVNPHTRAITEIDCNGNLDGMEAALRSANLGFYTGIERVRISRDDDLWVDGDGTFTMPEWLAKDKGFV